MAAAVDSPPADHHHQFLHIESLPLVDLRLLSQSELFSLSLCSSFSNHRPNDHDAVIPKIDRSVFNESAGSRKQTFSKLRLAPRNSKTSSSVSAIPNNNYNPEPVDEENAQIIGLLQQLFGVESNGTTVKPRDDDSATAGLVSVQVQFQDPSQVQFQSIPIDIVDVSQTKRKRGRPRKNENMGIRIEEKQRTVNNNNDGVFVNALALVNVADPFGEEFKRRTQDLETESSTVAFQNISIDGSQRKRKRGRPRKNENVVIHVVEEKPKEDGGVGAMTMVNNNGVVVDVAALLNAEDPFGEELKRRTLGLENEFQLLEFMGSFNGEWVSQRKRRRIVEAGDLGNFLPRGWKIMLSLKRRAGSVWIICRRYISPDGQQFVSCKEVSSYLVSCFGHQDITHLKSSHTDGSLQILSGVAPQNGVDCVPPNDMKTTDVANNLLIPNPTVYTDHVKQAITSSSIGSDERKTSDENVNDYPASGTKVQGDNTASGTCTNFSHQGSLFIDEEPLKADNKGLIEDPGKQIVFESGVPAPNFEGERCAADRLEDMNISDGNPFENDKWLLSSGNSLSETEDVSTSLKLQCSWNGFPVISSQTELKHASANSMNNIGGLDIDPNVKVIKDVSDDHAPRNEDVMTSFALETSSLNEQSFNCKMDNQLSRSFEENSVTPTGDEPLSAFDNNSNMVSSGTLETLKVVEAGRKNPQLDSVSCNNDAAVDAYSTTSIVQGTSPGCVSAPFTGTVQNKFEEQGHDDVGNAKKFCLTEMPNSEQVEICHNDEDFLTFGRNQIESDVDVTSGAWNNVYTSHGW